MTEIQSAASHWFLNQCSNATVHYPLINLQIIKMHCSSRHSIGMDYLQQTIVVNFSWNWLHVQWCGGRRPDVTYVTLTHPHCLSIHEFLLLGFPAASSCSLIPTCCHCWWPVKNIWYSTWPQNASASLWHLHKIILIGTVIPAWLLIPHRKYWFHNWKYVPNEPLFLIVWNNSNIP